MWSTIPKLPIGPGSNLFVAWFPIGPGSTLFIEVCSLVYYFELLIVSAFLRLKIEVKDVI